MAGTGSVVADADDPRTVIVKRLSLVVEGRPDMVLDLSGDLSKKEVCN